METNEPNPSYLPPTSSPEEPASSGRSRKVAAWIAGGTAAALVFAGTGFAVGRASSPSPATANPAIPNQPNQPNQYGEQFGQNPFGNQDPFGDSDGPGTTSRQDTTAATAAQLVGLVRIETTLGYQNGKAAGTGMILSSDGQVVTNHHVVEGSTQIRVTVMSTGKTYSASVVGADDGDDIALLQLKNASGLQTVKTDNDTLSVGDKVTAVGDAMGATKFSAAAGEVLGLNENITTRSEGSASGEKLTGLIEISSDVISGDSGGATYDAQGEVTGMTTAASQGGDITGYAIPIRKVLSVVDDLDSGVKSSDYTYGYPAFLGIGLAATGTVVGQVYDNTPAASAGLAAGDTITAVDGKKVTTSAALRKAIAANKVGDKVSITWKTTSGAVHRATVTLIQGPVS